MKKKSMSAKAAVHAHEAAMHPGKPKSEANNASRIQNIILSKLNLPRR